MKKNPRFNRLIAFSFLATFSVNALAGGRTNPVDTAVPVTISFAGLINDQPVFQLNFAGSPEQNKFTILIQDENGITLYRENTRGEHFCKKFLLDINEIGDQNLRFEIYCTNTKKSISYEVNRHTRFSQEVAVRNTKANVYDP